ncbi:GNAT family N-acetyltransferase [Pseudooctadecabacter sp.]|uniref:GNAT family N-acetyltransferase n=1 Tax=Pseudooctadecabacter sp. TaxID=1966338 RepID=UPI0035C845D0
MTKVVALGAKTVVPMLDLAVRDDQDHLVAPNAVTLPQALFEGGSEVYGIYDGSTPAGLLALIDFAHDAVKLQTRETRDTLYIWRLMIDANHQGRGHGRAALAFAADLAQTRRRRQIALSVVPDAASALPFYEASGFAKTGRKTDGELELTRRVRSPEDRPIASPVAALGSARSRLKPSARGFPRRHSAPETPHWGLSETALGSARSRLKPSAKGFPRRLELSGSKIPYFDARTTHATLLENAPSLPTSGFSQKNRPPPAACADRQVVPCSPHMRR